MYEVGSCNVVTLGVRTFMIQIDKNDIFVRFVIMMIYDKTFITLIVMLQPNL